MNAPVQVSLATAAHVWNNLKRELIEVHQIGDDDPALFDTLDGIADLPDRLRDLLRYRRQKLADAEALKSIIKDMQDRHARLQSSAEGIGRAVAHCMLLAGVKSLPAPDFTASVRYGQPPLSGAETLDPTKLPDRFVRIKREVNRTALRDALEAGENIEGVYLGNPQPTLTVRTK
jgi:Siphovirus Gp157